MWVSKELNLLLNKNSDGSYWVVNGAYSFHFGEELPSGTVFEKCLEDLLVEVPENLRGKHYNEILMEMVGG